MKCELDIFSQEGAADSTPTLSSGTPPSLPSNGIPTPAPSSEAAPPMDGSPACGCTRETFGCSTHPNTREAWIASMRGSLARILALPAEARESTANAPGFTARSCESPVLFDPATSSWKTPQQSLVEDWEPSLGTWPSSGMMRGGLSWPLPRLVPRTSGIGGGALPLLPTICAADGDKGGRGDLLQVVRGGTSPSGHYKSRLMPTPTTQDNPQVKGQYANPKSGTTLGGFARMWGTPRASDGMQHQLRDPESIVDPRGRLEDQVAKWTTPCADDTGHRKDKYAQGGSPLSFQAGGKLNPAWVAWLMGWPMQSTELSALETAKFPSARQPRGKSLAAPEMETLPPSLPTAKEAT